MGIIAFVALALIATVGLVYITLKNKELVSEDWETLVAKIQPVPFEGLKAIALEQLNPCGHQIGMEPEEILSALGGFRGLAHMRHNANVMLDLALYVRSWNFTEAMIVAEKIRQDSIILKRALAHIEMRFLSRKHRVRFPFYLQQAAAQYYLMNQRLLTLYENNQFVLYPRLASAL